MPYCDKKASVVVMDSDQYKRQAAEYAVESVQSGMVVGLGHGSTALFALRRIAEILRNGEIRDILGVPCSRAVAEEARKLSVPLTTLEKHPRIDLTIDGADEVAPDLNLIKGGGGALLHEKIVAQASERVLIIVDDEKLSPALGTRSRLPVEVTSFGWRTQALYLEGLGAQLTIRQDASGSLFLTDEHNFILDCAFGTIAAPEGLARQLQARAGIVAHGLFLGITHEVIVAGASGVRVLRRGDR